MPAVAREVATKVLHRVTEQGAWAAVTLDAELRRVGAEPRDAALATEIVYGTLRVLPEIDASFGRLLTRPAAGLDAWARAALRAATYQLRHLSRVPPHAVVNDTVAIVRRERGARLGGFVNAVLRKVARDRPASPASPTALALPAWLELSLGESLGPARAERFLEARRLPPPICLRVHRTEERSAIAHAIREARPEATVELGYLSPLALLVRSAGDPRRLPGYREGAFAIQEQGAQAVALLAGAAAGQRVADVCAGRGGKTALLAEQVGPAGRVLALDVSEPKLERMEPELVRLGVEPTRVDRATVDLSVGIGGVEERFDRVLVDAPCTGLGTIHRRPELLLRVGPDDPARMADLQVAILEQAMGLAAPGAIVTYAVCSPTHAEGAGVVARVREAHPRLEAVASPWPLSTVGPDPDGLVRIGPWGGGAEADPSAGWDADAYQVARWRLPVAG